MAEAEDLLARGWAALRRGDAAAARVSLERAAAEGAGARATEGLARSWYLDLQFAEAVDLWEQAYAGYRVQDETVSAIRVARTLAGVIGQVTGDFAVCQGWLARADSLLGESLDAPERGWVALNRGMFEADRHRKDALFREAVAIARKHDDRDLEFVSLAYLGASLVHGEQLGDGMALLDEALAAVAGSEVDDFCVLEEIFCQLFSACEHAHDVVRADQWIRVGDAVARRRRLPAVSAFCRTHYGAVLTAAGRWPEAEVALTDAVRLWSAGQRAGLRGGALARLADLRVRQGSVDEAGRLLVGLPAEDPVVARPLAAVHLVRGHTALARDVTERALAHIPATSAGAVPLLALLVDIELAVGDTGAGAAAVERLQACADLRTDAYVTAVTALARGRVCLATGSTQATECLRSALAGFNKAQLPMELARSRLDLATAYASERPQVALAEARAALAEFERLRAAHDADEAAALLRSLGARVPAPRPTGSLLTRREAEVLELLGSGLSNPEISDRLFISRKTVEHHVSAILTKLELRSRAEAAAYAAQRKSVET